MVSLLIGLDELSLLSPLLPPPPVERIAAGAARVVEEEVGMAKKEEDGENEEGRVSRTENVPGGDS